MAHKAYVIGASLPAGGAYMLYRLGLIVAQRFGFALVDVAVQRAGSSPFSYDKSMRSCSLQELDQAIDDDDLLISAPAFSNFLFGARLPGRKIMYAQGFNTHGAMDGQFDLYVSASETVQRYLSSVWGISAPVIAPFVEVDGRQAKPWSERPKHSALVFTKKDGPDAAMLMDFLHAGLKKRGGDMDLSQLVQGNNLPHDEFLSKLASVRYLINLTLAEGFGLVPLEAMAVGTMVVGLDGLAGRDYLRYGENSLTCSYRELNSLADIVYRAMMDEALSERCARAGMETAKEYSFDAFEQAWLPHLSAVLGRSPK
ncbi:MAG: glycosyltransferase [Rickettsiales bacterium]|jgi:hypothetical protein|nr:glycosyltransferase [Rickettsiales bacterium]